MKLKKLDTYVLKTPSAHAGGPYHYYIKLTTDDGVEGWGETALLVSLDDIYKAFDPLMQGVFESQLKGRGAMDREAIAKSLYNRLGSGRPGYLSGGVMSAFDLALWDLAGKYCNRPVYDLLGGVMREKVRAYSYIYSNRCRKFDKGEQAPEEDDRVWFSPEKIAECARAMVEEDGFTALKFDPLTMPNFYNNPSTPWSLTYDDMHRADLCIGAVRKAVGDRVDILIGTHGQTTTAAAVDFCKVLEGHNVRWFEEPVQCENRAEMGRVAASTRVPIASGERLVGVHEFQQLFEAKAVAYAQPDLGACGGITVAHKVAGMAEAYYVEMAPHVWGGAMTLAAAVQLDAAIPNFFVQESHYIARGIHAWILDEPIDYKDGYITPSTRPGLGHNLVESQLEKYRAQ